MKYIVCENSIEAICTFCTISSCKGFWPTAILPKWSSNKSHVIMEAIMKTQSHPNSTTNTRTQRTQWTQRTPQTSRLVIWTLECWFEFLTHCRILRTTSPPGRPEQKHYSLESQCLTQFSGFLADNWLRFLDPSPKAQPSTWIQAMCVIFLLDSTFVHKSLLLWLPYFNAL